MSMRRHAATTGLTFAFLGATVIFATSVTSHSLAQDKHAESTSPLDRLDPAEIPAAERFDWQPNELVAVLGSHRGRHWDAVESVAFSPNGKQIASTGDGVVRLWDAETLREVAVLRGHKGSVVTAAYSKEGNTLASAGLDGTIRLWDLTASPPTTKRTLSGHEALIYSLAYSEDGKALASGDSRGVVLLWDLAKWELRAKLPPPIENKDPGAYKYQAVAFSPDGTLLATSNLFYVVLWDLKGKDPVKVRTLKPSDLDNNGDYYPCRVQSLAFSSDGTTLAAGHYDRSGARIWDLTGDLRREVARLDSGTTRTIAFSPDGKTLASVGSGNSALAPGNRVLLWDMTQKPPKLRHALPIQRYNTAGVAFSPDGKTALSGGADGLLRLWDLSGKDPKAKLPVRGHDDEIRLTALSPDGKTLANTSWDGTLRLWDFGGARPKPRETFRAISAFATAVCFTADGKKLVTGNSDASVRIWDVSTDSARLQKTLSQGKPDSAEERDEIWGLALSPDGKKAVTSGRFHGMRLWDLTEGSGDPVTAKKPPRYHGALAFSPDGSTVASGSTDSGTLSLWSVADAKSPKVLHQVDAGKAIVHAVAFAPNGKTVVSGGEDGVVRFWSVTGGTLKELAAVNHEKGSVQSVYDSPDGNKLVVAYGSGCVLVCDSFGKKLHEWQLDGPASARFAPDGRHVVTENGNATVYILRLPIISAGDNPG